MTPDIGGFMDGIFLFTLFTVVASLAIPLIIVAVVVWAIRRRRDPAEESLRGRLARGEIDQAEFLVRMRALHDGDDSSVT